MQVPINLAGGSYRHKSPDLSAQTTRNFWPVKPDDAKSKSDYVLDGFYGLKPFLTDDSGVDRGMFKHLGVPYKVTGSYLYKIKADGTSVNLGRIKGSGRCIFTGIGTNIVITTSGFTYILIGIALSTIKDEDLESPNACTSLNNQVIFDGNNGRFVTTDVGDAQTIDGLNYAAAESHADVLHRPYVFEQKLYLLGDETIETWWNSGVGKPPFDRMEGGIMEIGLGAIHSVANSSNYMYLFGNDCQVYRVQGATEQAIAPDALARDFSKYGTVSDAIGFCMSLNEGTLYCLTFPSEDKTFLYPEGGEWFEWGFGNKGRSLANSYCYAYGKHLIADYRNGNVYELDDETYTDNGAQIIRVRDSAPLHGGLLGCAGKDIEMNSFELILETGNGLTQGQQGDDPVVMLSFSDDGGRSFSTEMWATTGRLGASTWECKWSNLGRFNSRIIRVSVSDPVKCSIHSAVADLEACI